MVVTLMSTKKKSWVLGFTLAAAGVILARLVSPRVDQPLQLVFFLVGVLIALTGVGVVTYGIRKGAEARSSYQNGNTMDDQRRQ